MFIFELVLNILKPRLQGEARIRSKKLIVVMDQGISEGQYRITGRLDLLEKGHVISVPLTKSYPDNVNVGLGYPPKGIQSISWEGLYMRAVENIPISDTERDGFAKIALENILTSRGCRAERRAILLQPAQRCIVCGLAVMASHPKHDAMRLRPRKTWHVSECSTNPSHRYSNLFAINKAESDPSDRIGGTCCHDVDALHVVLRFRHTL